MTEGIKIAVVSGGFDPIHTGHIAMIKEAATIGDTCVILLNSDEWLTRKKGTYFQPFNERAAIIGEFECVDAVIPFDDRDNTAIDGLRIVCESAGENDRVIFCNGGDRASGNTPEGSWVDAQSNAEMAWSVGGDFKMNSSSDITGEWLKRLERRN